MREGAGTSRRAFDARGVAVALVVLGAIVSGGTALGGCGGSGGTSDPTVLRAGQLDIKLPDGFKVVDGKVVRPAQSATGGAAGAGAAKPDTTATTIVDTTQDPTTALFGALGKFRACLDDLGVNFIGAPDSANPNSPTNDPTYIKNLSTCAARSNIVQALQASQSANDNLSPAEIKQRNKAYLKWRSCMIDRGWKIEQPKPDSQGRLFSFSTSGTTTQIQPPPGKDVLTSKDLEECAAKAQKSTS
jgi:hypothetical protein